MTPRKKWSNLPLAVRRLAWWWLLPFVVVVAGAAWFKFGDNSSLFAGSPPWPGLIVPVAVFAPLFVSIAAVSMGMRRMKRAYAASEGRLCTGCTHNLQDLGESGACPECGRPFEIERDRRAWKQAGIGQAQ